MLNNPRLYEYSNLIWKEKNNSSEVKKKKERKKERKKKIPCSGEFNTPYDALELA